MKSERRHELKDNSLAGFLENLPYYARVHGNKVLTGLIVVLLVIAFVRWRNAQAEQKQNLISGNLATARAAIDQLSNPNFARGILIGDPKMVSGMRQSLTADANNAIDTVAGETEDKNIRAEALVAKADLNWALANLPELPAAATQPTLKSTTSAEEYLTKAAGFYQSVLEKYSDEQMAVTSAQFGLAACAENRRDIAKAQEMYNAIIKSDALPMYKTMAEIRLKLLADAKAPLFLGTLKPEATTQTSMTQTPSAVLAAGTITLQSSPVATPTTAPAVITAPVETPATTAPTTAPATQP